MKLYLVQHGLAVDKSVDPERPLSDQGVSDVQHMAAFLKASNVQLGSILHSGKTRALQTAKIFSSTLGDNSIYHLENINPNDALEPAIVYIDTLKEDTMLVGHLPFMQRMVSFLLCDNESTGYHFQPGSVVCLNQTGDGWEMDWMIRPDLITH